MDGETERCHCGAPLAGSDHCPVCGCEQHEATCGHVYKPCGCRHGCRECVCDDCLTLA